MTCRGSGNRAGQPGQPRGRNLKPDSAASAADGPCRTTNSPPVIIIDDGETSLRCQL